MAKNLTAASVAKMRPVAGRLLEIPDAQAVGLYLLIYPSGKKIWALRYRRPKDRRPAKLTLGTVFADRRKTEPDIVPVIGDHMTLAGARRLVAELRHEIALGRDPGAAHIAKKRSVPSAEDAFAAAARDFIEDHARKHTRRWQETARTIGLRQTDGGALEIIDGSLSDRWRDLIVSEIDEDVVFRVVDEARRKGVPGIGRRNDGQSEARARSVHSALSVLFGWLKEKRRIKVNPMAALSSPSAPKARDHVLTNPEIARLWAACDAEGFPFGHIIKLLLLTGCRREEVGGMRRSELSEDLTTLTIPGRRTKNHRVHVVPLPPIARDVIRGVDQHGDLVFTTNGSTAVSGFSKFKKRLDAKLKIEPWRIHDLRRTAATGMAEIGVAPHIVEACLNHVSGARAGVAGTYNRAAYAPEKKAALERWADHIDRLVTGNTAKIVVTLRGRKRT